MRQVKSGAVRRAYGAAICAFFDARAIVAHRQAAGVRPTTGELQHQDDAWVIWEAARREYFALPRS